MSYAIIRNQKYKRENLKGIFRHNERKNENYSNKNIDKEKSYLNYSLKDPKYSYEKDFERIRKEYNLKGQIKTVSNIVNILSHLTMNFLIKLEKKKQEDFLKLHISLCVNIKI